MMNIENNLLELVLDQMGCISVVDTEGRYVYVNEFWVKSYGIKGKDAIGRLARDVELYTEIDYVMRNGEAKVCDNIISNLENNIVFAAYIPLVEKNSVVGGFTYTKFKDRNYSPRSKKMIEKMNYDHFSKLASVNKIKDKRKKLIYFDDLNLKEKQDLLIKETLVDALEKSKGNKSNAAKMLGISRTVIYDKLKKYNLM